MRRDAVVVTGWCVAAAARGCRRRSLPPTCVRAPFAPEARAPAGACTVRRTKRNAEDLLPPRRSQCVACPSQIRANAIRATVRPSPPASAVGGKHRQRRYDEARCVSGIQAEERSQRRAGNANGANGNHWHAPPQPPSTGDSTYAHFLHSEARCLLGALALSSAPVLRACRSTSRAHARCCLTGNRCTCAGGGMSVHAHARTHKHTHTPMRRHRTHTRTHTHTALGVGDSRT